MPLRTLAADRLFEALDGSLLHSPGRDWRVAVFGVFEEAGHRWVQLALECDSVQIVTLRLGSTQSPRYVIKSLSSWLSNLTKSGEVLAHGAISALIGAALPPS